MHRPRRLGRALRVDVVAEGVEDRPRPAGRAVRGAHTQQERGRILVRRGGVDHVHARAERVQAVPAAREERLVGLGTGLPERRVVDLVPDYDVVDRRDALLASLE